MNNVPYNEAIENIKQLVKADPFNNAVYQRLSVYAKSYVVALDKNPTFAPKIKIKAMKHITDNNLQNQDATGTINAIIDRLHKI